MPTLSLESMLSNTVLNTKLTAILLSRIAVVCSEVFSSLNRIYLYTDRNKYPGTTYVIKSGRFLAISITQLIWLHFPFFAPFFVCCGGGKGPPVFPVPFLTVPIITGFIGTSFESHLVSFLPGMTSPPLQNHPLAS